MTTKNGFKRWKRANRNGGVSKMTTMHGFWRIAKMIFKPGESGNPKGRLPEEPMVRFQKYCSEFGSANCWNWEGALFQSGYGQFWSGKKTVRAHRWIFERLTALIPKGKELDHLCRNIKCVNPNHLEVVTHQENMSRGIRATKIYCWRGHPLFGNNLYIKSNDGGRQCKKCHNIASKKYRLAVKSRKQLERMKR